MARLFVRCRWWLLAYALLGLGVYAAYHFLSADPLPPLPFPWAHVRVDPDPNRYTVTLADLASARDFEFVLGEGGWPQGHDVVRVEQSGRCRYTFFAGYGTPPTGSGKTAVLWKEATFTIDAKTVGDLQQLLIDERFFSLGRYYGDTRVSDGTTGGVKVRSGGIAKRVWCDNYFPRGIERISRFVHSRMLDAHAREIGQAPTVNHDRVAAASHAMEADLP